MPISKLHRSLAAASLAGLILSPVSAQDSKPLGAVAPRSSSGLCRRAPLLAALAPEEAAKPRQPVDGTREFDRNAMSVPPPVAPPPVVMPAPMAPPPPALPPPPPSADIAVTGSAIARAARPAAGPPRAPVAPGRGDFGVHPQSGILTAGEHDDLLNPELYARYIAASDLGQRLADLPRVDTGRVLTVAVTDADGRPMPLTTVTVTCADGNHLDLATLADGTATFFPGLDRLGASVQVGVSRNGQALSAARAVAIPAGPGPQRISFTASAPAAALTRFDLVLMVDTTGSMGDELRYLQSELRTILDNLRRDHAGLDIRVGLVFYRDTDDDYVTRSFAFTGDQAAIQANLAAQAADGGGDMPEAVDQALNRAVHFPWRPDAVHSLLWVADAPPHDDRIAASWQAAEMARAERVQIVPVAASGVDATAEYFMRAAAAITQSRYLFLTDDSGVGNAHAPPEVDCYLVTRLDQLVRRVLDSQISGRRIEPQDGEVIRTVGQYDSGRCIVPRGER